MAGGRAGYDRLNISCPYKTLVIRPVENENKLVFRVIPGNPAESFIDEIAITFQVISKQKPRINSNDHVCGPVLPV